MGHLVGLAVVPPDEHPPACPARPLPRVIDLEDVVAIGVGLVQVLDPLDGTWRQSRFVIDDAAETAVIGVRRRGSRAPMDVEAVRRRRRTGGGVTGGGVEEGRVDCERAELGQAV